MYIINFIFVILFSLLVPAFALRNILYYSVRDATMNAKHPFREDKVCNVLIVLRNPPFSTKFWGGPNFCVIMQQLKCNTFP